MKTKPEVFIVESNKFEEEEDEKFEGRVLMELLRMCGKDPTYFYIRTKRELVEVMGIFSRSNYRYLHLACHGERTSIFTTLDEIPFGELGEILNPYIDSRRLFISACEAVNVQLANAVMPNSGCLSIIGPYREVTFDDAAIVWASFYQLMFRENWNKMRREDIEFVLEGLTELFEVPIAYCGARTRSRGGYRIEVFGDY